MARRILLGIIGAYFGLSAVVHAQESNIQKVAIEPLEKEVSMSTVDLYSTDGWVTCPTVEMRGRQTLLIQNISNSDWIGISGVSGATAGRYWKLYPYQYIKFKVARGDKEKSGTHIYASSHTATVVTIKCIEAK